MRFTRNTIAAAATIVALGVLAAVALASVGGPSTTTAPAPSAETDPPPEVRTEVVRRTVHRDASTDDDGTADQGPGDAPGAGHRHGDDDGPNHDVRDDHGHDGPNHDVGDDHGGGDDNSGPGSDSSGSGHGGGNSGRGHGGED
jgi:hypothetical protein